MIIEAYLCPPRCDAGGVDGDDGGHVFDRDMDLRQCNECGHEYFTQEAVGVAAICPKCFVRNTRSVGGSLVCKCGTSAMDYSLMTGE